ncbi:MAG: hypothetical protein EOP11_15600 [Proteobacteria bacterium]|nr:MAG: hypothetical protein EOP11_15600 [Pseudomonadota bacterium]
MQTSRRLPLAVKIAYSAFMAVMIPVYWYFYGPTNFLYFCDVALILTLVGVWRESALLISMCAVGIILPQMLWVVDFFGVLIGHPLTGMTAYMFNGASSLFLRGLSLFHGWLPFLLLYLVVKLGYDKRGLPYWTFLAWALIAISYLFLPAPRADAGLIPVNVNYVWGLSDAAAQTWMPAYAWLALLTIGMPLLFFWPTHLLLRRFLRHAAN